jgi:DNA-directed RNA polymerase specialized sigma subunit
MRRPLMDVQALLNHATKVAEKLWRDDEARSEAGWALIRALDTFDPEQQVPIEAWVTIVVKRSVICLLRREKRKHHFDIDYWREVRDKEHHTYESLRQRDLEELQEHYETGISIGDMAKRRGISRQAMHDKLIELRERFWRTYHEV